MCSLSTETPEAETPADFIKAVEEFRDGDVTPLDVGDEEDDEDVYERFTRDLKSIDAARSDQYFLLHQVPVEYRHLIMQWADAQQYDASLFVYDRSTFLPILDGNDNLMAFYGQDGNPFQVRTWIPA